MSYYDKPGTRLGLSLPPTYLRFAGKLPVALRRITNLYVLLVENKNIKPFEPGDLLDAANGRPVLATSPDSSLRSE
jgi:hypothetical protein